MLLISGGDLINTTWNVHVLQNKLKQIFFDGIFKFSDFYMYERHQRMLLF